MSALNIDGWKRVKLMPVRSLLQWERECEGSKGQEQWERGEGIDLRAAHRKNYGEGGREK